MVKKGEFDVASASAHYVRMQALRTKVVAAAPGKGIFGCVDVGNSCYWWDYGMLKLFIKNNRLALADSTEAKALRQFLNIPASGVVRSNVSSAQVNGSVVLASTIKGGSIVGSVCSNVRTVHAEVKDTILVNVTAKSIKAQNCVIYNVVADGDIDLVDGAVLTNVFMPGKEKLVMSSTVDTDGGQVFKQKLDANPYTFNEVYMMNKTEDVAACMVAGAAAADAAAQNLGLALI